MYFNLMEMYETFKIYIKKVFNMLTHNMQYENGAVRLRVFQEGTNSICCTCGKLNTSW